MEHYLGLAEAMARRYAGRGQDHDDLRQVAVVGLLKALARFEPDRGVAFSTFAVPTILGELRRHFRDHGWVIRVTRPLQDLHRQAEQARGELQQQQHGRSPTVEEVARHLGRDGDDVRSRLLRSGLEQLRSVA